MKGLLITIGNFDFRNENIKRLFSIYPWIKNRFFKIENCNIFCFFKNDFTGIFENNRFFIALQGWFSIKNGLIYRTRELYFKNVHKLIRNIETGMFNIILIDKFFKKFYLINDRFGLLPLYYYVGEEGIIISSRIDAIRSIVDHSFTINLNGIKDLLTFGYIMGFDTLYNEIKLFPHASILEINLDTNNMKISRYWRPTFRYTWDRGLLIKKLYTSIQKAINRFSYLSKKKMCFLSGGLDSRTIYALHDDFIDACTWGFKNSGERKFAKRVTEIDRKGKHLELELNQKDAVDSFYESLKLTEGMRATCECIPAIAKNVKINEYDLAYDGYLGDVLFGGSYFCRCRRDLKDILLDISVGCNPIYSKIKDVDVVKSSIAKIPSYNHYKSIFPFNPSKHAQIRLEKLIKLSENEFPNIRCSADLIDLLQIFLARGKKRIRLGTLQFNYFTNVLLPYFDYQVFDVYLQIPPQWRAWHKIYMDLYKKYLGTYGKIQSTTLYGLQPATPNSIYRIWRYIHCGFNYLSNHGEGSGYLNLDEWLQEGTKYRSLLEEEKLFLSNYLKIDIDIDVPNELLIRMATIGAYLRLNL